MLRRNTIRVVMGVVLVLAIIGTGVVAYGKGRTAGQQSAASDRSNFARGTTVAGGQGAGGFGGRGGGAGGPGGAGTGTGAASAGGAGTDGGTTAAAASNVTGKVTKADNGTLTLQEQPNNIAVTVATTATTSVTTFAAGALGDLKTGDIVAVQGDKTGDTAYTAKTIFALNAFGGGGGNATGGQGQGQGAPNAAGTAPADGTAGAGRGRAPGAGGAASAPAGRAGGGGGLLAGLNGPTGRITAIANGTVTLQGFDGATTTVTTNASTTVRKQTTGNVSDIKVGDTVAVQGDKVSDQAYTARTIIDQGSGA